MEAVAAGISATIVGIVIVAIIVGAINGSVFWAKRNGLVIGAVASIAILLLLTAFMGLFIGWSNTMEPPIFTARISGFIYGSA